MTLSIRQQWLVGILLAGFIILTRGHHFANVFHLADISWAAFFIAGVYIRSSVGFSSLFALCVALDFIALAWGNAGIGSCFTTAYGMLLPAYAAMWFAGRVYRNYHSNTSQTLLPLVVTVLLGSVACELLSSGGYYVLSGKFEPTLAEFTSRFALYYPSYLSSVAFYVGITAGIHALLLSLKNNGLWFAKTH